MDTWSKLLRQTLLPGTLASLASTTVLALSGRSETGSMFAGVNAISHWLWGRRSFHVDQPTLKHTLVGYVIHHASAMFWAALFEKICGKALDKKDPAVTVAAAATTTAVAYFTDYQLTPERLQPGFEERLSRTSLALVYVAFGVGLAAGAMLNRRN